MYPRLQHQGRFHCWSSPASSSTSSYVNYMYEYVFVNFIIDNYIEHGTRFVWIRHDWEKDVGLIMGEKNVFKTLRIFVFLHVCMRKKYIYKYISNSASILASLRFNSYFLFLSNHKTYQKPYFMTTNIIRVYKFESTKFCAVPSNFLRRWTRRPPDSAGHLNNFA